MKKGLIPIFIFGGGIVLDYATTFYGLSKGFIELHPFSNVLKLVALMQFSLLILIKMKPEWIDLLTNLFCISIGTPLLYAGVHNIFLVGELI